MKEVLIVVWEKLERKIEKDVKTYIEREAGSFGSERDE